MIRDFKPRLYQETIFGTCINSNCLVVLPTGMGKTSLGFMMAVQRIKQYPKSKILVIAPTKPLVEQHLQSFKKHLIDDEDKFVLFTGSVKPEKRAEQWIDAKYIFSTPQGLENDIISRRIDLKDVSLLVVDEAHRAVQDYSYVWVSKQYEKTARFPRILALTASPGSDLAKIEEVCKNLHIEEIEVRTDKDSDVAPYIQDVKVNWVKVKLSQDLLNVRKLLEECFKTKVKEIKGYGYLNSISQTNKMELLKLQGLLHSHIAQGDKSFEILKSISLAAEAMKVQHAIELLETQSIQALFSYMEKLEEQSVKTKVKAVKNLVKDVNFRMALIKIKTLCEKEVEHPKLEEVRKIVRQGVKKKDAKIIIFTQYRDTGLEINNELNKLEGVSSNLFVGQAKKKGHGMSQKEQIQMLNDFKEGKFNTICMTSVGEEGLDIPEVDSVVFYEPIPSAIRTIQRRGRTGRTEKGNVIVLMSEGTRDEGYRWSAHHKEKRMHRTLEKLKNGFRKKVEKKENTLMQYSNEVKIIADHREKGNSVIKELIDLGIKINLETLEVGDYLCSRRVGIEYKKTEDFVNSIIDGRLLEQIKNMKRTFERSLVIVEGIEDIYTIRNIHPNAIRGMLATIAISYGIPIIYTKNTKESANLLALIAKREQEENSKDFSNHTSKKPATQKELQEYIVGSLPSVGGNLAKELLKEFSSVRNIVNASAEDLKKVEKLGEKKAKAIRDILDRDYF